MKSHSSKNGVYVDRGGKLDRFRWVKEPLCPSGCTAEELSQLIYALQGAHTIAYRIGRYLEREGLLVRDAEHSYLALDEPDEDPMNQLQGHSITYRIAAWAAPSARIQGRKVFTTCVACCSTGSSSMA